MISCCFAIKHRLTHLLDILIVCQSPEFPLGIAYHAPAVQQRQRIDYQGKEHTCHDYDGGDWVAEFWLFDLVMCFHSMIVLFYKPAMAFKYRSNDS